MKWFCVRSCGSNGLSKDAAALTISSHQVSHPSPHKMKLLLNWESHKSFSSLSKRRSFFTSHVQQKHKLNQLNFTMEREHLLPNDLQKSAHKFQENSYLWCWTKVEQSDIWSGTLCWVGQELKLAEQNITQWHNLLSNTVTHPEQNRSLY